MPDRSKRLGRGIDSLISPVGSSKLTDRLSMAERLEEPAQDRHKNKRVSILTQLVPLRAIAPNPNQPRREISEKGIQRLAESIAHNGLIQPIVVRPIRRSQPATKEDRSTNVIYELIAGERRWRAARAAGLSDVPAIIREADDQQLLELALVENLQREDLNAIDRANAYLQFQDRFGLSAEQLGHRIGEDRTTVTNYLRLLELPDSVQDMLAAKLIRMGHARCLAGLKDSELQLSLAKRIVMQDLSVRELEDVLRKQRSTPEPPATRKRKEKRPHIRDLERQFSRTLQVKVRIEESARKNRGRIILEYHSLDDFDRVCQRMGIE